MPMQDLDEWTADKCQSKFYSANDEHKSKRDRRYTYCCYTYQAPQEQAEMYTRIDGTEAC